MIFEFIGWCIQQLAHFVHDFKEGWTEAMEEDTNS